MSLDNFPLRINPECLTTDAKCTFCIVTDVFCLFSAVGGSLNLYTLESKHSLCIAHDDLFVCIKSLAKSRDGFF